MMQSKAISEDGLFQYTRLWPHTAALPMRIWLPDEGAENGNIRVQTTHAAVSLPNEVVLVSIFEQPELVEGTLSLSDLAAVMAFVMKRLAALRVHSDGDCDSADLIERLRR
jgi:hypothetical protein